MTKKKTEVVEGEVVNETASSKAIATRESSVPAPSTVDDITKLLDKALDKDIPVETMERLVALHERVSAQQAVAAYNVDMAALQAEMPAIEKKTTAKVTSKRTGTSFKYNYAELDEIVSTLRPIAVKHGFSWSWDSVTEGNKMKTTCTARHIMGHSGSSSFESPVEESQRMSKPQAHAAVLSFGRRQSLIQVFGLVTCDPDTDAKANVSDEKVDQEQEANIEGLLTEVNADRVRFLKHFKIGDVSELRKADYSRAVKMLEAKR